VNLLAANDNATVIAPKNITAPNGTKINRTRNSAVMQ
jgi:hypothetical protein